MPLSFIYLHPLAWAVAVIAVYALVKGATAAQTRRGSASGRAPGRRLLHDGRIHSGARVAYLSGPFLLAAALRVAEPWELGLIRPPSNEAVLVAAGFVAAMVAAIVALRRWFSRAAGRALPTFTLRPSVRATGQVALDVTLLEFHWAFFRAAVLAVGLASTTLAVFLALGLLALQALADPWARRSFMEPMAALDMARPAFLALGSTMAFLATGSTPVCLALHLAAAAALWRLGVGNQTIVAAVAGPRIDPAQVEPTVV